jgi:hypothetical protein
LKTPMFGNPSLLGYTHGSEVDEAGDG